MNNPFFKTLAYSSAKNFNLQTLTYYTQKVRNGTFQALTSKKKDNIIDASKPKGGKYE